MLRVPTRQHTILDTSNAVLPCGARLRKWLDQNGIGQKIGLGLNNILQITGSKASTAVSGTANLYVQ